MSYRKCFFLSGFNGGFRTLPVSRASWAEAVLHRRALARFRGAEHARAGSDIRVDFEQTKEAYRSKDTAELLRGLLVFKLCSYDLLVDRNKEVHIFIIQLFNVSSFPHNIWMKQVM